MKKYILWMLLPLCGLFLEAKPMVAVSILPQKTFVEKIAKDRVDIVLMVAPGNSPHAYEPKASQMVALSQSKLYFSIGVEFEKVWLPKFASQNRYLRFVDMSATVKKIAIQADTHGHEAEDEADHESHRHEGLDPHTWTDPKNVALMAETIYQALIAIDPENQPFYAQNRKIFLEEIARTDASIKAILEKSPHAKFMVFHPSWGYFSKAYGLTQVAIEVEGKNPKPKTLMHIIDEAKEEKVRVIFAQPEFSDKSARIIAKEVGIKVVKISPLAEQWSQNLIKMAEEIAK